MASIKPVAVAHQKHNHDDKLTNTMSLFSTTGMLNFNNSEQIETQNIVIKTEIMNPANDERQINTENQAFMCDTTEGLNYLGLVFDTSSKHETKGKQENCETVLDMLENCGNVNDMNNESQMLPYDTSEIIGDKKDENSENQVLAEKLMIKVTGENHELESDTKTTFNIKTKQRNGKKQDSLGEILSCEFCNKPFSSAFQLMKHVLKHDISTDKGLKCVSCEKYFTARGLRSHVLRAHMPVPEISTDALAISEENKSEDFETFIVSPDGRKAYKCKTCGERFWYIAQVTKHVWKHTKITPYQCTVCGIYKRELGNLKKHMLIHEGKLPECQICNKQFSSDRTLRNHISLHTGEKTHKCEICGDYFRLRMSLRRHQLNKHPGGSSTAKNQCTCPECGKQFVNANNLRLHMFTHSDEKRFDCAICGRHFRQPDCRDQHQKTHLADANHICSECGDVFKTSRSLKLHREAQHNIEARHECQTCGKFFKYGSALSRHKVLHSGEKRYKCEACEKSFATSYSLQCHLRSHAGVKQFACSICEASFTQRENLNRHIKKVHKAHSYI